jgi:hypothetical protein
MPTTKKFKDIFEKLVEAYVEWNETAKETLSQKIKESGKNLRITVDEDLQWEESQIEGYKEYPIVIQSIEVFLDDELVYECARWFGSEKLDSTHTGLGGRWVAIRVDEGGHDGIIELLEDFGHSVEEPYVPEWR